MFTYNLQITDSYEVMGTIIETVMGEGKKDNGIKVTHKDWKQIPDTDFQSYNAILDSKSDINKTFIEKLRNDYPNASILATRVEQNS